MAPSPSWLTPERMLADFGGVCVYDAYPNIVGMRPNPGFRGDYSVAVTAIRFFEERAAERGPCALLVMADGIVALPRDSRRAWRAAVVPSTYHGVAFVCRSRLAHAIGSVFLGFSSFTVPTGIYTDEAVARAWLEGIGQSGDGR